MPVLIDLKSAAHQEMIRDGFEPDFPPDALRQLGALPAGGADATGAVPSPRDLRGLVWSSIDNPESRDLDQVEVAELLTTGDIRVLVGIADVDSLVPAGSPIDRHAARNTTSVYCGVVTFPMLPEQLSTDRTSLNERADRLAVVIEVVVAPDGTVRSHDVYRALVHNTAQLDYPGIGAWLEATGAAPAKVQSSAPLEQQL
ncbi:MAG: RNB domain-containing ribonuclease, partial [Gemmatimonadales bacterium]